MFLRFLLQSELMERLAELTPRRETISQQKFYVELGITPEQVEEVVRYTLTDQAVGMFTSDAQRFSSVEAFNKWREENKRMIYTLVDESGQLAGISWVGEKELPSGYTYPGWLNPKEYHYTTAVRVYGVARGVGVGSDFQKLAIEHYLTNVLGKTELNMPYGFWGEAHDDNIASRRMCARTGFKEVAFGNNKVVMVL